MLLSLISFFFFFNDTATTEIYTLSLHDLFRSPSSRTGKRMRPIALTPPGYAHRSEEHTSELQSRLHLVCRLLLEKKKRTLTSRGDVTTPHVSPRPGLACVCLSACALCDLRSHT